MNVAACGRLLSGQRDAICIAAPDDTPLHHTAADILGMVSAYLHDGDTFLTSGDWVNALAAYCYGFGWLHFGIASGLFGAQSSACPLSDPCDTIPTHLRGRLDEKASRYARLLDAARAAVVPAPERGTAMHTAADRILVITAAYAMQGHRYLMQGQPEDALACASYGHGWLDAAVRAGLFTIKADRELFTV